MPQRAEYDHARREAGCCRRRLLVQAAVLGAGSSLTSVAIGSARQALTPDHLLGRVVSASRILGLGGAGLGALLGGVIADGYGLTAPLVVALGTPGKLMDERMGHEDGSVQARYSHVTADMRRRLLGGLTGVWSAALDARRAIVPSSPVAVLDRLLRERA